MATHKFALAAWAQGFRHGCAHAALKGDVSRATLSEIQEYRDSHLAVLEKTVVCVVGGVSAESVRPVLTEQLGKLASQASEPLAVEPAPGKHEMTWDLDARHLVLTWPIPRPAENDYPPVMIAGQLLSMRCFSDPELKALTGMVLVDTDLTVPEGNFFCVSASLRAGASFDAVRQKIERHLQALRSGPAGGLEASMLARQQAHQLTTFPDPSIIKPQAPKNVSPAMIEGNLGLLWGMREFRYGGHRAGLAKALRAINAKAVQQAVIRYLTPEKQSYCAVSPGAALGDGRP